MSRSRIKSRIRAVQAEHGLSYREAKRFLDSGGAAASESAPPATVPPAYGPPATVPPAAVPAAAVPAGVAPGRGDAPDLESWEPPRPTAQELVVSALVDQCDRMTGAEPGSTWDDVVAALPYDIDLLWLGEITVDKSSVELDYIQSYEEDTDAFTVTAEATVRLEGTMSKADAAAGAGSNLLSITDPDHNRHYAQVLSGPVTVQLQFEAIVLPLAESATLALTDVAVLDAA